MYVWGFIWSSGKVSPNKRCYNQDIIKTRNTSYGFTETRQKDHWKIISLWRGREWNTHFRWWTCANGNGWSQGTAEVLVIGLHMVGIIEYRIIFKVLESNEAKGTEELFIIIFFFSLFFLFFSLFLLLKTVGNTMHLLHLPPHAWTFACPQAMKWW